MTGKDFIRRAKAWSAAQGLDCSVTAGRGKGGHQMLEIDDRRTFVQTGELPPGTLHAMLKQLNIPKGEF